MSETLSIVNLTKVRLKRLPFFKLKNYSVGETFEVSLVFIGEHLAKRLNKTYRGKDYTPNVLTFPLGKRSGEIFICPKRAEQDAKKFAMKKEQFLSFLFIHALIHLKGLPHGSTMKKKEAQIRKKFGI